MRLITRVTKVMKTVFEYTFIIVRGLFTIEPPKEDNESPVEDPIKVSPEAPEDTPTEATNVVSTAENLDAVTLSCPSGPFSSHAPTCPATWNHSTPIPCSIPQYPESHGHVYYVYSAILLFTLYVIVRMLQALYKMLFHGPEPTAATTDHRDPAIADEWLNNLLKEVIKPVLTHEQLIDQAIIKYEAAELDVSVRVWRNDEFDHQKYGPYGPLQFEAFSRQSYLIVNCDERKETIDFYHWALSMYDQTKAVTALYFVHENHRLFAQAENQAVARLVGIKGPVDASILKQRILPICVVYTWLLMQMRAGNLNSAQCKQSPSGTVEEIDDIPSTPNTEGRDNSISEQKTPGIIDECATFVKDDDAFSEHESAQGMSTKTSSESEGQVQETKVKEAEPFDSPTESALPVGDLDRVGEDLCNTSPNAQLECHADSSTHSVGIDSDKNRSSPVEKTEHTSMVSEELAAGEPTSTKPHADGDTSETYEEIWFGKGYKGTFFSSQSPPEGPRTPPMLTTTSSSTSSFSSSNSTSENGSAEAKHSHLAGSVDGTQRLGQLDAETLDTPDGFRPDLVDSFIQQLKKQLSDKASTRDSPHVSNTAKAEDKHKETSSVSSSSSSQSIAPLRICKRGSVSANSVTEEGSTSTKSTTPVTSVSSDSIAPLRVRAKNCPGKVTRASCQTTALTQTTVPEKKNPESASESKAEEARCSAPLGGNPKDLADIWVTDTPVVPQHLKPQVVTPESRTSRFKGWVKSLAPSGPTPVKLDPLARALCRLQEADKLLEQLPTIFDREIKNDDPVYNMQTIGYFQYVTGILKESKELAHNACQGLAAGIHILDPRTYKRPGVDSSKLWLGEDVTESIMETMVFWKGFLCEYTSYRDVVKKERVAPLKGFRKEEATLRNVQTEFDRIITEQSYMPLEDLMDGLQQAWSIYREAKRSKKGLTPTQCAEITTTARFLSSLAANSQLVRKRLRQLIDDMRQLALYRVQTLGWRPPCAVGEEQCAMQGLRRGWY